MVDFFFALTAIIVSIALLEDIQYLRRVNQASAKNNENNPVVLEFWRNLL